MASKKSSGSVKVTFIPAGGDAVELSVSRGALVQDVLEKSGNGTADIEDVRLNGRPTERATKVKAGDLVAYLTKTAGGR